MTENQLAREIVDAAFRVHTTLGPGLLEHVHKMAMACELEKRRLHFDLERGIPASYDDITFDSGFAQTSSSRIR